MKMFLLRINGFATVRCGWMSVVLKKALSWIDLWTASEKKIIYKMQKHEYSFKVTQRLQGTK